LDEVGHAPASKEHAVFTSCSHLRLRLQGMDEYTNSPQSRPKRRYRLLGSLVLALLVGAVGIVAYDIGHSNGAAEAALAEGAAVIYAPASGPSTFALILGLGFAILLIGFVARAIAGPRHPMGRGPWGHRGRGPWGHWGPRHRGAPGDWDHEDIPEPFRPMLERWHRGVHDAGTDTPAGPGQGPPGSAGPGTTDAGMGSVAGTRAAPTRPGERPSA
jgi:hypothetical protein